MSARDTKRSMRSWNTLAWLAEESSNCSGRSTCGGVHRGNGSVVSEQHRVRRTLGRSIGSHDLIQKGIVYRSIYYMYYLIVFLSIITKTSESLWSLLPGAARALAHDLKTRPGRGEAAEATPAAVVSAQNYK